MRQVAMFIDGFNFYYAIKHNEDATPIGLGWCDFRKLAEGHMMSRESERLHSIKYFTAPVKHCGSPKEQDDQSLWLRAARTIPGIQVIEGFHHT